MDPIREGVIRFIDKTSSTVQMVTRAFGFMPDGRELIRTDDGAAGLTVSFSDRADEGWPPFSLTIPREAHFALASMGLLTRQAQWHIRLHPEDVMDFLLGHNEGFPEPDPNPHERHKFEMDDGVTVIVGGSDRRAITLLFVTQARDPDSMQESMMNKLRASEAQFK